MYDSDSKHKVKTPYPANHLIDWYLGNYLHSPNNAIREDPFKNGVSENWKPIWFDDIENVRNNLKGDLITHYDFIRLVKESGIHNKYYHYKKYENDCEICKALGIR